MNIKNVISISTIMINLKNPVFFILSTKTVFEVLSKHNGALYISESFALNLYIFFYKNDLCFTH